MKVTMFRLEWKVQDVWIGVFWKTTNCKTDDGEKPFATDIWICLLPCVPLHITIVHPVAVFN